MSGKNIKIKIKAFDLSVLAKTVTNVLLAVDRAGGKVLGPILLPREKKIFTVTRSPHVDKKSMEQFGKITYKRLIVLVNANASVIAELSKVELSHGVGISIKTA